MIRVFTGYWPSNRSEKHTALQPCVKLVCGKKVVSIIDRGLGFSTFCEGDLKAVEVDSIACFKYPEEVDNPERLWDNTCRMPPEQTPKTMEEALNWLLF